MVELSKRLKNIENSASMQMMDKVARLKSEGLKIIDLAVGEPDFETPDVIKQAAFDAISKGCTKYTSARGIAQLREEICGFLQAKKNVETTPENVVVTPGAKQAIFYALASALDEGDEVLVPEPSWVSFRDIVKINGGKPVAVASVNPNRGIITN